ncbi:MAG: hypothetical protein CMK74_20740 [Pseudomonadales bacterium]|nr:hypothetical protein [Pseudomonadales bacterium]|tara:strand:+ start:1512 stop:2258 length:747 start_codon:yes stop_codon:yes gene_type:complete
MPRKPQEQSLESQLAKLRRTVFESSSEDQDWAIQYLSRHNLFVSQHSFDTQEPISKLAARWPAAKGLDKKKVIKNFLAALRKRKSRRNQNGMSEQTFMVTIQTDAKIKKLKKTLKLNKTELLKHLADTAIKENSAFEKERRKIKKDIKEAKDEKEAALISVRRAVREVYEQLENCLWELSQLKEINKEEFSLTEVQFQAAQSSYMRSLKECRKKCETVRLMRALPSLTAYTEPSQSMPLTSDLERNDT